MGSAGYVSTGLRTVRTSKICLLEHGQCIITINGYEDGNKSGTNSMTVK